MTEANRLYEILRQLDDADIKFELAYNRDNAVSIMITVPGERWEIDVFDEGAVEVERFVSGGVTETGDLIDTLVQKFGSPPTG